MFRILLFLHIIGIALWLGSIASISILNRKGMAAGDGNQLKLAVETTRSVVRGIINPSAIVVLISGIVMIVQMGLATKPFWLMFMERFGGMLVLLSVGFLTWYVGRMHKETSESTQRKILATMSNVLAGVGVAVAAIVLVVALRL